MNNDVVALYHPDFQFKADQLAEMLTLQAEANAVMDSQWRATSASDVPYYRASFIESAEAVQHYGYKWWKATKSDLNQTRMELIDILHFCLSDILRNHAGKSIDEILLVISDTLIDPTPINPIGRFAKGLFFLEGVKPMRIGNRRLYQLVDLHDLTFNDLAEQLVYTTLQNGETSPHHLYLMFEKLDMTPVEVHGLYAGKNALNKFRTASGQLQNEYFKIWDGREDNEHLTDYIHANRDNPEAMSFQSVYNFLSATYSRSILTN